MPEHSHPHSTTFQVKLELLFETVHPADRGPYTNGEVADAITAQGGAISSTYLWMLRNGKRDNPTKAHLEHLARFFGVKAGYFFDDNQEAEETLRDLRSVKAMQDLGVRKVAARLADFDEDGRRSVLDIIERVLEYGKQSSRPTTTSE